MAIALLSVRSQRRNILGLIAGGLANAFRVHGEASVREAKIQSLSKQLVALIEEDMPPGQDEVRIFLTSCWHEDANLRMQRNGIHARTTKFQCVSTPDGQFYSDEESFLWRPEKPWMQITPFAV